MLKTAPGCHGGRLRAWTDLRLQYLHSIIHSLHGLWDRPTALELRLMSLDQVQGLPQLTYSPHSNPRSAHIKQAHPCLWSAWACQQENLLAGVGQVGL